MMRRLHVIAIGGLHQFYHFLPAVFALEKNQAAQTVIFVLDENARIEVAALARHLAMPCPEIVVMHLPAILEKALARLSVSTRKTSRLLAYASKLRDADMLLSAERTSTLLKRLPGRCPHFVHIPHGAGDRAVGFEPRLKLFDHIITIGEKDRTRMIAEGLAAPDSIEVGGSVKFAAVGRLQASEPLFDNDRPIVLYNPHFSRELGSFEACAENVVTQVARDGRYNLIVAPHIRLAENWSPSQIEFWQNQSVPGSVIVDLGSQRCVDMTYITAADLYLGDVSSQVYEFAGRPRPCLFINTHCQGWGSDENYAMWQFGPVVSPDENFVEAIDQAFASHKQYRDTQQQRARLALGLGDDPEPDAIKKVAGLLQKQLTRL